MRKLIAVILLMLFLFGDTEAHQLLKLPLLVQHYIKHKKADAHITIIGFLKMHYQKKLVVDDDYAQDMQLPFKTFDCNGLIASSITLPPHKVEIHLNYTILPNDNIQIYREQLYSLQSLQDIFQPPRI